MRISLFKSNKMDILKIKMLLQIYILISLVEILVFLLEAKKHAFSWYLFILVIILSIGILLKCFWFGIGIMFLKPGLSYTRSRNLPKIIYILFIFRLLQPYFRFRKGLLFTTLRHCCFTAWTQIMNWVLIVYFTWFSRLQK